MGEPAEMLVPFLYKDAKSLKKGLLSPKLLSLCLLIVREFLNMMKEIVFSRTT